MTPGVAAVPEPTVDGEGAGGLGRFDPFSLTFSLLHSSVPPSSAHGSVMWAPSVTCTLTNPGRSPRAGLREVKGGEARGAGSSRADRLGLPGKVLYSE